MVITCVKGWDFQSSLLQVFGCVNYISFHFLFLNSIVYHSQDLGHGPFSHVFDTTMKKKLIEYHASEINRLSNEASTNSEKLAYHKSYAKQLKGWKHEKASCDMFDHMIENTPGLKNAFEEKNLGENERKLIKDIIMGKTPRERTPTQVQGTKDGKETGEEHVPVVLVDDKVYSKWFLFEIVANKVYEIDCDKFDYFARDCHNLGMKSNFDHLRYINNISIMPRPDSTELHLCVRDKLDFNTYELFHTRWSLHHRAYQHKTTKAIEEMITDAFVLLEDKYKFSEAIFDMEKYAMLTDSIFYEILRSKDTDEKTTEAQNILRRIQRRNLYKLYAQFQPVKKIKDKNLKNAAKKIAESCSPNVDARELLVSTVNIHFGQKEKDPVKSVVFYDKERKTLDPICRDDVSRMLPQRFTEQFVRVYDKKCINRKEIVATSFKKWQKTYLSDSDNQWIKVAGVTTLAMIGAAAILRYSI